MTDHEHIVILSGIPTIADTPVIDIVRLWRSGVDLVDIPIHLPQISVVAASAALRYYGEHMAETE